jgi:hypothetical protein
MRIVGLTLGILFAFSTVNSTCAETRVEKKLAQFGGPETRSRCIKDFKTKGVPACTTRDVSWRTPLGRTVCEDTWMITCSEFATDLKQHEYFLIVSGPDAPAALERTLRRALEKALAAAIGAAAGTPGEIATKIAAAYAAFKITLAGALAVEPLLASMKDEYRISAEDRSHW